MEIHTIENLEVKRCKFCNVVLTEDNQYNSMRKTSVCKACHSKRSIKRHQKHQDECIAHKNRPTREVLERLYVEEFKSVRQISDLLGYYDRVISAMLKDYGISIRTVTENNLRGKCRPSRDELHKMYTVDKMDTVQVGEVVGVRPSTINKWLRQDGIQVRSIQEVNACSGYHPTEEELCVMYYDMCMTPNEIGNICGVHGDTVVYWLKKDGFKTRSQSETLLMGKHKPTKDDMYKMYVVDNMSTHQIGTHVGVSHGTIRKWLVKYDIDLRNGSEALMGKWVGELSPVWRGGLTKYCHKFNESFRESIREEFGRKCFICGKSEEDNGQKLSVHHTNFDRNCMCGNVECRFVSLCKSCHGKTNYNRFYWYSRILGKLLLESSADYVNLELNF